MFKKLFWFLGLYLLPIGLLLLFAANLIINTVSNIIHTRLYLSTILGLIITITPSIIATLINTYLFVFKDTRNFNLLTFNAGRPNNIPNEKWKAMNPSIPKRYLSDKPIIGTIGFSYKLNKYITIPVIEDFEKGRAVIVGVIAGSGAGKTTTLQTTITQIIEQYPHNKNIPSLWLTDLKPDIYQRMPNVFNNPCVSLISFSDYKDESFWGLDMYGDIGENDDDIIRHMRTLANAFIYNKDSTEHASFFYDNARNIFCAYLYATYKHYGMNFIDAIAKLTSVDLSQNIEQLLDLKDPKVKQMLGIYADKSSDNESFADIQSTIMTSLYPLSLDSVKWALRDNPRKVKPSDLLNGKNLITKCEDKYVSLLSPLIVAFYEITINYILALPDRVGVNTGTDYDRPILMITDEMANLPFSGKSINRFVSLARSKKAGQMYLAQSVDSMQNTLGEKNLNGIFENTTALVVLSAMSEGTLKLVQNTCGNYRSTMYSSSISGRSSVGNISNSTSEQYRPIMEFEDTRALRQLNAFIAMTADGWFRGNKYTIRDNKELLERSDKYVKENTKFLEGRLNMNNSKKE